MQVKIQDDLQLLCNVIKAHLIAYDAIAVQARYDASDVLLALDSAIGDCIGFALNAQVLPHTFSGNAYHIICAVIASLSDDAQFVLSAIDSP